MGTFSMNVPRDLRGAALLKWVPGGPTAGAIRPECQHDFLWLVELAGDFDFLLCASPMLLLST